jgi:hypothetical protein
VAFIAALVALAVAALAVAVPVPPLLGTEIDGSVTRPSLPVVSVYEVAPPENL